MRGERGSLVHFDLADVELTEFCGKCASSGIATVVEWEDRVDRLGRKSRRAKYTDGTCDSCGGKGEVPNEFGRKIIELIAKHGIEPRG